MRPKRVHSWGFLIPFKTRFGQLLLYMPKTAQRYCKRSLKCCHWRAELLSKPYWNLLTDRPLLFVQIFHVRIFICKYNVRKQKGNQRTLFMRPATASWCHRASFATAKDCWIETRPTKNHGPDFQNILRQSYDNAEVTIDLRRTSNLQNILRGAQSFS